MSTTMISIVTLMLFCFRPLNYSWSLLVCKTNAAEGLTPWALGDDAVEHWTAGVHNVVQSLSCLSTAFMEHFNEATARISLQEHRCTPCRSQLEALMSSSYYEITTQRWQYRKTSKDGSVEKRTMVIVVLGLMMERTTRPLILRHDLISSNYLFQYTYAEEMRLFEALSRRPHAPEMYANNIIRMAMSTMLSKGSLTLTVRLLAYDALLSS